MVQGGEGDDREGKAGGGKGRGREERGGNWDSTSVCMFKFSLE